MDCDICGKHAKVHLTQLVGGQIKKITLCDDCAKEKGVTDPTGFALAEMLLGKTPGKVVPATPAVAGSGRRCPSCGFTLEDLRREEYVRGGEYPRRDVYARRELEDSDDRRPALGENYDRSRQAKPYRKSFWSELFDFD